MPSDRCLPISSVQAISTRIFESLDGNYCSKCVGSILTSAVSMMLVNIPDQETFEAYKKVFLECISELKFTDSI